VYFHNFVGASKKETNKKKTNKNKRRPLVLGVANCIYYSVCGVIFNRIGGFSFMSRNATLEPQWGYSEFQVTGMIEWGQKSIPKKIPRASNKTQKNPWTKNLPQKNPMPKFRALISRKD